ncbi:MAG: hypothetical protein K5838_05565 [Elusimicrobiales bacterium]|nr:hypothetical protein [Elusimicrobiales bacterium]
MEENNEQSGKEEIITVNAKKGKIFAYAALSMLFLAIPVIAIITGFPEHIFSKIICWAAIIFSALFFILICPILIGQHGLIIDSKGLTDCTKLKKIGPVPWKDFIAFEKAAIKTKILKYGKPSDKEYIKHYLAARIKEESDFSSEIKEMNANLLPGDGRKELFNDLGINTLLIDLEMLDCLPDTLILLLRSKITAEQN